MQARLSPLNIHARIVLETDVNPTGIEDKAIRIAR